MDQECGAAVKKPAAAGGRKRAAPENFAKEEEVRQPVKTVKARNPASQNSIP